VIRCYASLGTWPSANLASSFVYTAEMKSISGH